MSRVTHWRVYLPTALDEKGNHYVEVSETAGSRLLRDLAAGNQTMMNLVTDHEVNPRDSRTLYIPKEHIIAIEPIEG